MDSETRQVLQEYAEEIRRLNREVNNLKRGTRRPQLAYSSLESGQNVEVRDDDGNVRTRIGWQPDGTAGLITEGGDAPPAPTAPTVEPSLGGLRVTWDGAMANEVAKPGDLGFVQVHVSTTSGFTPDDTTRAGSIPREGGMLPIVPLPYEQHHVRLVGVTTGGITGDPSTEATATPVQVDEPDLTAGSVTAAHIQAGAIEADKLASLIVLASRLVAGTDTGARVELNENGFRAYNSSEELTVSVDAADGSATLTGTIIGSAIEGGSITIGDTSGAHSVTDSDGNGNPRQRHISPSGAMVRTIADTDAAQIHFFPPDGIDTWDGGVAYAFVNSADQPVVSYTSPSGDGDTFSQLTLEGGSSADSVVRATLLADQVSLNLAANSTETDGAIGLNDVISIVAPKHWPRRTDMAAEPGFGSEASFVDFTSSEMPTIQFRTSRSGHTRITITAAGYNTNTDTSSLALGFSLSGPTSVGTSLARSWYAQSRGQGNTNNDHYSRVVHLELDGDADYTLTPAWRISSGDDTTAEFNLVFENSIVVEPLV